ncbi:MAG: hypothetical protein HOO93_16020 [Methyloglobulus sp.]|nr:hypothetical protein [Methyloglobulus sp.]
MNEQDIFMKLPIHLFRYVEWRMRSEEGAKTREEMSYMFNFVYPSPRFELCDEDVPKLAPRLSIRAIGLYTLVESDFGETVLEANPKIISHILDFIDGSSTVFELIKYAQRQNIEADFETVNRLIGTAIIVPDTIKELESAIHWVSITRYPSSPYHIVRNYWKNMRDVRTELEGFSFTGKTTGFIEQLRKLHAILLLGSNFSSFYQTGSVPSKAVWPGCFRSEVQPCGANCGSEILPYLQIVALSLGDVIGDSFDLCWEDNGLCWATGYDLGSSVQFSAPLGPFEGHLEHLCSLLSELQSITLIEADSASAVSILAKFHQRFVQLHPFECANNSLAMSIVNYFLNKWFNTCIPHLHLDCVAFFFSPENYSRYFARAVKYYAMKKNDDQSLYVKDFKDRLHRVNEIYPIFISAAQSNTLDNMLEEHPETARDLLLLD